MANEASGPDALDEVQTFLKRYPDTEVAEVLLTDTNGLMRGKQLPANALAKVFKGGVRLPASVFALDIWGNDVEASGLVFETGDADRVCTGVPGSLKPVTWLKTPTAQVLMSMLNADGTPFYGDPRQVLAGVLARYSALGLTPVVATELEFYLFDVERGADGRLQPPRSPITGQSITGSQLYGIDELQELGELFGGIARACAAQDVPTDTLIAEHAPGQYEINLTHVPDALLAADQAVMLKRAIKGVASQHRTTASFMAKPFGDRAGNGFHIHFSLLDRDGRNVFDDGTTKGSPVLRHAVAGQAATMAEGMAVFAPNTNSYRRFQPGSYAPIAPAWGYDNRSTALRIPLSEPEAMRIEHRVAGADANPYLTLATVLAGAIHGIVSQLEPQPPTVGDAYRQHPASLPDTWERALEAFEGSSFIAEYLSASYRELYCACKWQELNTFKRQVTPMEYNAYLRTV